MIAPDIVTAWRTSAPWQSQAFVEQDLVLSRALVELFQQGVICETCTLRGGTALNKLIFRPALRYSEDIDLVQEIPGPIGPLLDAVRYSLDAWLGKPRVENQTRGTTLVWRFQSSTEPPVDLRLKVEINTREHGWIGEPIFVNHAVESPWYSGNADVTTVPLSDLMATKVRALYQRRKGRDLFDLHCAFMHFPDLDLPRVIRGFRSVMKREGHPVSLPELELNLEAKLAHKLFAADVAPLLVTGDFDAHEV